MWILGALLWAVCCYWIMSAVYNKVEEAQAEHRENPPEKSCPPHKWVSKKQPDTDQDYMQCSICDVFPGYTDDRS